MMNRETSIRKRKYSEEFLNYGFTFIAEAGIETPVVVRMSILDTKVAG